MILLTPPYASLSPIQRDIFLDELSGSRQSYVIGQHCILARPVTAGGLAAALTQLEPEIHGLCSPIWQANGVESFPKSSVAIHKLQDAAAIMAAPLPLTGALVHLHMAQRDEGLELLLLTHHILFDGEAIAGLLDRLLRLAEGDDSAARRADPVDPGDFDRPATLAFWRETLPRTAGFVDARPQTEAEAPELVEARITDAAAVQRLCRRHRVTEPFLFKCLFGLALIELHGIEGQALVEEIVNLRPTRARGTLGCLSALTPFVLPAAAPEEHFGSWIARAKAGQAARKGHERLSQFMAVQIAGAREGFRAIYNHHGYSGQALDLPGLTSLRSITSENPNAIQFYLHRSVQDGLCASCSHPRGPSVARTLVAVVTTLLDQLAQDDDIPLERLSLLDQAEADALDALNRTAMPFDDDATLAQIFDRRAALVPDRLAVSDAETTLSFAELHTEVTALAARLVAEGVAPRERVGIFLDRSVRMAIAVLAVVKVGAAYVPLDTGYPDARLGYILDDARVRRLLVDAGSAVAARERGLSQGRDLLVVGPSLPAASGEALQELERRQDPAQTAYVIYTSGSTGQPKGVMLAHRGVVNRLAWMQDHFRLGEADRILQKTPFGFDVSVWELFWGPLFGIPTHYAPADTHRDPQALGQVMRDGAITIVHFVPSMLEIFLDAGIAVPDLRFIVCSGEALGAAAYEAARACYPQATLVNLYGPTEASIDVTCWQAQPGEQVTRVPIGKPIWNTSCHIVSQRSKQLPRGFAGELLLGGVQLAQGYLGRPELTAERFIPDFVGADSEARLYRTGDLAEQEEGGDIFYLGRVDDQLKINGLRIEPGEIEQQMLVHPDVRGAVVVAGQGASGRTVLRGYVTLRADCSDTNAVLAGISTHLAQVLPAYMVPARLMVLDEIPLSVNGKVNRKALPVPETAAPEGQQEPLRTATERALAALWGELLHIDPANLSRSAQFLEMGGNSLLLMQLQNLAWTRLRVALTMRDAFFYPTLGDLAAHIDTLAPEPVPVAQIPKGADPVTQKTASFPQARLWLLDQIEGSNAQYNLPVTLKVSLPFDTERAERILQRLVDRHAPLRTSFDATGAAQVQAEALVRLRCHDLRVLPTKDRRTELNRLLAKDAVKGFDLTAAPLLRSAFFQTSEEEGWFLVNIHHIASDGWSMGILLQEFLQLWDAPEAELPPLPLSYTDYARWQHDWVQTPEFEVQMAHWLDALSGAPEVHKLPLDFPRPERQGFAGADHTFEIDADLVTRLRAVGRAHRATLFMVLHAGFTALIERWSGQSDVVIGTPVANRLQAEVESLVGFFANTLALRVQCDSDASFETLLDQVREVNVAALANQSVPFELVVERLNPGRSKQYAPVFQVMFAMDPQEFSTTTRSGTRFERVRMPGRTAKFDLLLQAVETDAGGVHFTLEYCSDLFRPETIVLMGQCLQLLLEGVARDAAQPLGAIDCLPTAEKTRQIDRLNATWRPVTLGNIGAEIAKRAASKGDQTAVICGETALSHAELDRCANRIARVLLQQGAGLNTLVGICLRPSTELVCGMYGILKAQAAYVPIDPGYPEDRIAYMLRDSNVQAVLVDSASKAMLARVAQAQNITLLDLTDAAIWAEVPDTAPDTLAGDPRAQLFYTIYTSGSTGNPKAAQVVHHGVQNMLQWYVAQEDAPEHHCALVMSSIAFDLTQKGIWGALLLGGRVVLDDAPHFDAEHLRRLVARHAVTRITCAPSGFYPLVEEPRDFGLLNSLRQVFLGGEAIVMKRLRPWLVQSDCRLVNYYGPSECTDAVAFAAVDPALDSPPVGRPLPNTQLYVLNRHHRLLPPGALGELHIGGDCVGPGYRGKPELTLEKFTIDPFSVRAGATMYKTGDLVRLLPDGQIAYHGRMDDQVKVRGFRIELGEIEASINQLPEIAAAAVIADTREGETWILGFVTTPEPPVSEEAVGQAVLRHLRASLPAHMVPVSMRWLPEMPLSPNGKINRKELPRDRITVQDRTAPADPPATDTERALAALWAELLALDATAIAREAQFFDLGGNSILVTRLLSRMRQNWSCNLALSDLFDHADLQGMASLIDARAGAGIETAALLRRPDPGQRPLTEVQRRIWFLSQLNPGDTSFNIFGAYDIDGHLDEDRLAQALACVVAENPVLRTRFAKGQEPVQWLAPASEIALRVLDLPSEALPDTIAREAAHGFRLDSEPLLRLTLARTQTGSCLLVNIHHVISDGWSLRLFVEQMCRAYETPVAMQTTEILTADRLDYADFAAWQSRQLSGPRYELLSRVWRERLAKAPTPLNLPATLLGQVKGAASAEIVRNMDPDAYGRLRTLAKVQGVTPFMLVLALYATLLSRHTGQEDLTIGSPVAGRLLPQAENMLGCFINVLPLRLSLEAQQTLPERLAHVREVCLEAFDHQDMPFERIVELANPPRQVNRNPLFDVMLNWNEALDETLDLKGIILRARPIAAASAKYALTLYVDDLGDQVSLRWTHQPEVLPSDYVEALAEQFDQLCAQVMAQPDLSLQEVPLGVAAPRAECPAQAPLLAEQLDHAFGEHAERIALVEGDSCLTYAELRSAAARVARRIRQAELPAGSIVAVSGTRGSEMITALVGAVMAGAVIMPVDRLAPSARLAQMVAVAQPRLLLWSGNATVPEALAELPTCLLALDDVTGMEMLELPALRVDDPAYVFFTSGTTGVPKAILGHQGGLANFVQWQRTRYGISPGEAAAHLTGIGFDVVLRDIFVPLVSGAALHVPETNIALAPAPLFDWMRARQIAWMHGVPSILRFWLQREETDLRLPSLKRIFVAGEPLTAELVAQWRQRVGAGEVTNLYGPTETTLAKFAFDCDAEASLTRVGPLPVGTPLPGTTLRLRTARGLDCGTGEPGEVFIETPDASKGYLGQPMVDPFADLSDEVGHRLIRYRTGDRGFLDAKGQLHLLGRSDDQIKIRGVRIELAEVQTALRDCPALRDAHVLSRQSDTVEPVLVAYILPRDATLDTATLRRQVTTHLRRRLSPEMVPGIIVPVDGFRLTANGKLDRRALPEPPGAETHGDAALNIPPRPGLETQLYALWQAVLGHDRFGRDEGFFDVGGHSLLLMQMRADIERELGLSLPLVHLFDHPTIETLARLLEEIRTAGSVDPGQQQRQSARDRGDRRAAALARRRVR